MILAATVAMIIGTIQHPEHGWIEGLSIYIAVVIIVSVTAGNDYVKEKQFQKLVDKANEDTCIVQRGNSGETHTINTEELLVGDVFRVQGGMKVPADAILIHGIDVCADESSLTGEPDQLPKFAVDADNFESGPSPFLLAKTLIVGGEGSAMVCAVGTNTFSGKAEEKLHIEDEATPLQQKLEVIANEIGKIGVMVAIVTFIAMTTRMCWEIMNDEQKEFLSAETLNNIVQFIIIGITVIVVAVPEGLPLAVTMSLAFSVMQMKKENNLVRKLHASETMGGADQICTDKTGTLTKNEMTVVQLWANNQILTSSSVDAEKILDKKLLGESILYNCSAVVEDGVASGNCTEVGIIKYIMTLGIDAQRTLNSKSDNMLSLIPFNSKRKRATTVIQHPDDAQKVRVFCKGAPEIVIDYCTKFVNETGEEVDIDAEKKTEIID